MPEQKWKLLLKECAGKIDSLVELLQGKFSKGVMEIITHEDKGLFPCFEDIKLDCSCYDWADICKHVAAVLYGVGAHLDEYPQDLFLLREVNHADLIAQAGFSDLSAGNTDQNAKTLTGDLSSLFGIDIEGELPSVIYLDNKVKESLSKNKKPIQKRKAVTKKTRAALKK